MDINSSQKYIADIYTYILHKTIHLTITSLKIEDNSVQFQLVISEIGITVNVLKFQHFFLLLFSNKMLVIKGRIHKMLVRTANREDPDQTAS